LSAPVEGALDRANDDAPESRCRLDRQAIEASPRRCCRPPADV